MKQKWQPTKLQDQGLPRSLPPPPGPPTHKKPVDNWAESAIYWQTTFSDTFILHPPPGICHPTSSYNSLLCYMKKRARYRKTTPRFSANITS
jgi:hypothetical protein